MKKDFDITKTKLVIWDLDETFWDGTLSEGSIKFNPEHLQLVEDLTLKGIMNSICSKNDHSAVLPLSLIHIYGKLSCKNATKISSILTDLVIKSFHRMMKTE